MKGSDTARVSLVLIRGYLCITTLWKCLYVLRRCESVTTQFGVSQSAPSVLALVLNCRIHVVFTFVYEGFWHCKSVTSFDPRIFMYYDAVKMSLCTETLWKCHYTVWCFAKRSERPVALVLNCRIHIRVWRVLTLQECHFFWSEDIYVLHAVKVSLCTETLWRCHYTVWWFAKRSERPCISLELSYSHSCMKGSDTARVSLVLIRGYLCITTLWKCLYVLRRCESVTTQFGASQSAPSVLALVLNCRINIRVWRVLTLQECH